jgi:hypothetical protein
VATSRPNLLTSVWKVLGNIACHGFTWGW